MDALAFEQISKLRINFDESNTTAENMQQTGNQKPY
jgi:hypothetical protein